MQTQILGLLTPLMALGFAATFGMMWWAGGLRRHVLGFCVTYVLFAIGFLATHLLDPSAWYLFHTTQLLYSAGVIVFIASLCDRAGQRFNFASYLGIYAVSACVLALAVSLSDDVGPRLIILNNGYGAMFAMAFGTLVAAPRRNLLDLAILFIVGFQVADFLIRPNMTLLFEQTIPSAGYRDSVYYSLIGLVLGVKSVATAMLLIGATIAEWNANLRESGERDALTGLRDRGAFEQSMRSLMARAQTENRSLSLVVADIDHFKQVNDIWGHQAGDQALSGFATLIEDMVRGCDVPGRIGGEEFCIAVWNCEHEPAERLAERIRQAFARLEHPGLNDDIRLTASFGVAGARDGETYEQMFARADAALYQAKTSGRNRVINAEVERPLQPEPVPTPEVTEIKRTVSK